MSSATTRPASESSATERRAHPRRRLDQLAYVGFGPNSGGVLLDVSEEGLSCQIVGAVVEGDHCHLKFALPGKHLAIEADGQVVWSNKSRQGGGVRLVGLGPDARQELHEWINQENESASVRPPAPMPIRSKTVGAVHVPSGAVPEFVVPLPIAAAQVPIVSSPEPAAPIGLEFHAAAVAASSNDGAAEIEIATETPVNTPQTIAAQEPALRPSNRPSARLKHKTGAKTPSRPHAPIPSVAEHRASLPVSRVAPREPRFKRATVIAGCAVLGVVALAYSGFNPANMFFSGERDSEFVAPRTTPPVPPVMNGPVSPPTAPVPSEGAKPPVLGTDIERSGGIAGQAARSEAPSTTSIPANRPVQNPTRATPANSPQFALTPPRPRAATPSAPIAAPDTPLAPMVAPPPTAFMNLPAIESAPPVPPQPVTPQTNVNYQPPQLLSRAEPVYSAYAREARLQGTVRVNATVGTDGVPRSFVCVSGNSALCQMAFAAVAKWRYQPATSNGQAIQAQTLVSFTFQLR